MLAQKSLDNVKNLEGSEKTSVAIVRRAIEEPTHQLADNAGAEGALLSRRSKKRKGNEGYDVATGEYTDPVRGRYRRADEGHAQCVAKRRVHRRFGAHHRRESEKSVL